MKKFLIFIMTIVPLLNFTSCNDEDEIRKDMDEISARLDKLQPEIDKLNENIATFYDLSYGKILFTGYTYDSETGNYTISLSNGKTWTVYGGKPENGMPVLTIKDGKWVFEYNGEIKELGSATPEDGKNGVAPKMSIDDEGYWCYSIDGGEPVRVDGPYNKAGLENINPSIFEEVTADGGILKFKLYGQEDYTEIPVLGGLDITFSTNPVSVAKGGSQNITVTQTEVGSVVVSPTPLQVVLTDNELTITAGTDLEAGDYTIYFEIYSAQGYRLVKELKVTVTEA